MEKSKVLAAYEAAGSRIGKAESLTELANVVRERVNYWSQDQPDTIKVGSWALTYSDKLIPVRFDDGKAFYFERQRPGKQCEMKLTKYVSRVVDNTFDKSDPTGEILPVAVRVYLREQICHEAESASMEDKYTLVVDEDFESIYTRARCAGDFGSCMTNKKFYEFYEKCSCHAASLIKDGLIFARAILWDAEDENGEEWRLLDRQYALRKDSRLMMLLVHKLISEGRIDAYKRIGSGYDEEREFVGIRGEDLSEKKFNVECDWHFDSYIPYLDTFCYWEDDGRLYNFHTGYSTNEFKDTGGIVNYDEWYEEYTFDNIEEVVINGDSYEVNINSLDEDEYIVNVRGNYYTEDYEGLTTCDRCGEYIVKDDEYTYYSKITGEYYCCTECLETAEEEFVEEQEEQGVYISILTGETYSSEEERDEAETTYKRESAYWGWNPLSGEFEKDFDVEELKDSVIRLSKLEGACTNWRELVDAMKNERMAFPEFKTAIPVYRLNEYSFPKCAYRTAYFAGRRYVHEFNDYMFQDEVYWDNVVFEDGCIYIQ